MVSRGVAGLAETPALTSTPTDPTPPQNPPLPAQLPNGEVSSDQLRYLAQCIEPYGADGCADITTRANLQVCGGGDSVDIIRWGLNTKFHTHTTHPHRRKRASTPTHTPQIRGVKLEDADTIINGLIERGMSSYQAGMDSVRNLTGSPIAGLDPHEVLDVR